MLKMYAARQRKQRNGFSPDFFSSTAQVSVTFLPSQISIGCVKKQLCLRIGWQRSFLLHWLGLLLGMQSAELKLFQHINTESSSHPTPSWLGFVLLFFVKPSRNFMLCSTFTFFTGPSNWLPPFSQKPKSSMTS